MVVDGRDLPEGYKGGTEVVVSVEEGDLYVLQPQVSDLPPVYLWKDQVKHVTLPYRDQNGKPKVIR